MFQSGCHCNQVSIETMYEADAYCPNEPPYQIWIQYYFNKTKELLAYHCGCHGNLVTIVMRYVADAYRPKEPSYQIRAQYDFRQRSYKVKCI